MSHKSNPLQRAWVQGTLIIVWSLLFYCVKARDHCYVLCNDTRATGGTPGNSW